MKPPRLSVVAIVGRPNVGKSTLFNRLTKTRRAIMEETAGVTRDRIYGRSEWTGTAFDLVDTGGVEAPGDDELRAGMMDQTRAAIDEADVIIFLMDGRAGLTPVDHQVLEMLRDARKPILYVANKIDDAVHEAGSYALYEAGVDAIHCISSEHGRGISDFLDVLIDVLPYKVDVEELEEEGHGPIRVAMIGRPNAGKSSLINRLLGADRTVVSSIPGTTRDVVDSRLDTDDGSYILLDTAGIRRRSKTTERLEKFTIVKAREAIQRCDIAVLVLDATRPVGEEQDAKIAGYLQDAYRAVVVVVNKWDLAGEEQAKLALVKELHYQIKFLPWASVVFTSALSGKGVHKLLPEVKKAYAQFDRRVTTSELNRVLAEAILRSPPPSPGGRHVRIRFAMQVSTRPPAFVLVTNRPDDVHVTYRRYLTNQLREAFGFDGTPLKLIFREPKGRWKAAERFA